MDNLCRYIDHEYLCEKEELEEEVKRLREALEKVEWTNDLYWTRCLWCYGSYPNHKSDCKRQEALAT